MPSTVLQWCRLFKQCQNLSAGTVLHWFSLFKQCQILPTWQCVAGVQAA